MAVTGVVEYGEHLDVGSNPQWHVFDITGQRTTAGTETFLLMNMPAGSMLLDAHVCCLQAAGGAGTDTLDLQEDGADRKIWAGTSDNGGVVDKIDHGALDLDGSFFPNTNAVGLEALRTVAGGSVTPVAIYRVSVLMGRATRP